jgi:serine/threonine protein kinase
MSVDNVFPPLEYGSDEDDKIPFVPDGEDPVLSPFGTAMRVRSRSNSLAGAKVAVRKTIFITETVDPKQLHYTKEKVRMAAAQLSRTRHPHMLGIITTYFHKARNGLQFSIVVEFVQENLHAYLTPPSPPSDGTESITKRPHARWFGCLIGAVVYLHRRGIRHGDIKPESILVRNGENGETVLLSNFDLSEMDAWRAQQQTTVNRKWAASGRYVAPETEADKPRSRAVDIFSLGAVLLEMLFARQNGSGNDNGPNLRPKLESKLRVGSQSGTVKSYAHNVDAVRGWLAGLTLPSQGRSKLGWEAEVLSFCREMLDPAPDARPRADELSSRWRSAAAGADPSLRCDLCDKGEAQRDDATNTSITMASSAIGADADASVDATMNGPGETDLFRAAGSGHKDEVERLLNEKSGAVNEKNMDGWSALHYAARMNHRGVVERLLRGGANVELKDNAGWTALHFAARYGHEGVLSLLLAAGADVKTTDNRGHTALHLAADGGHAGVAKMLLDKMDKTDVNKKTTNQKRAALSMAASGGHREVVKLLAACDKVDVRELA